VTKKRKEAKRVGLGLRLRLGLGSLIFAL